VGEAAIEHSENRESRGCDDFGEQATGPEGRRTHDSHGARFKFDDDLALSDMRISPAKSRTASASEMWIVAILKMIPPFGFFLAASF